MDKRKEAELEQTSPPPYSDGEQSLPFPHPNPLYPPRPYHTQTPSRTLQVDFTGWTQRHVRVTEVGPQDHSVIYTVDLHLRKPNMVFKSALTNTVLGTVKYQVLSPTIKIHVHEHEVNLPVKMKIGRGTLSGYHYEAKFESPALQNAHLTWRNQKSYTRIDFECLDDQSLPLAKFMSSTSWNLKKGGRLELYGTQASSRAVMDEIVVTGLALVYYTMIQITTNTAAAIS